MAGSPLSPHRARLSNDDMLSQCQFPLCHGSVNMIFFYLSLVAACTMNANSFIRPSSVRGWLITRGARHIRARNDMHLHHHYIPPLPPSRNHN